MSHSSVARTTTCNIIYISNVIHTYTEIHKVSNWIFTLHDNTRESTMTATFTYGLSSVTPHIYVVFTKHESTSLKRHIVCYFNAHVLYCALKHIRMLETLLPFSLSTHSCYEHYAYMRDTRKLSKVKKT